MVMPLYFICSGVYLRSKAGKGTFSLWLLVIDTEAFVPFIFSLPRFRLLFLQQSKTYEKALTAA